MRALEDPMSGLTYDAAGVDIEKKHGMIARISKLVKSTFTPAVLHEPGAFGGQFSASFPGAEEPVLVATTDSVGTKVRLAVRLKRAGGLGHDIVNHCTNDILVQGAEPLFFLDYFAASHLDPEVFEPVVEGLAEACRNVGAALLGGETAEMPGVYETGEFDLVGFLTGWVERSRTWPKGVAAGDALVGLRSDGLHTNGYSLVNRIADRPDVDLGTVPDGWSETLADALLRPHRSYLRPIRALGDTVRVHALAHITGGGLAENLPRVLPEGLGAAIARSSWDPNRVFHWLMATGPVEREEAYRVFNMGCGMVVVLPEADADRAVATLAEAGQEAFRMGRIESGKGVRFTD
jgi:phosphoribosylformylglycinamidine cyclo-ligase